VVIIIIFSVRYVLKKELGTTKKEYFIEQYY